MKVKCINSKGFSHQITKNKTYDVIKAYQHGGVFTYRMIGDKNLEIQADASRFIKANGGSLIKIDYLEKQREFFKKISAQDLFSSTAPELVQRFSEFLNQDNPVALNSKDLRIIIESLNGELNSSISGERRREVEPVLRKLENARTTDNEQPKTLIKNIKDHPDWCTKPGVEKINYYELGDIVYDINKTLCRIIHISKINNTGKEDVDYFFRLALLDHNGREYASVTSSLNNLRKIG